MKKLLTTTALLAGASAASAGPALMLGVSHNFGGDTGVTLKLLSTNREERGVVALGVSFAPGRDGGHWSWDTGVGYNFKNSVLVLSYDWVPRQVQVSLGVANLKAPPPPATVVTAPAPSTAPAPAPAPTSGPF